MTATTETPRLYEKETAVVIRKLLKATYPTVKFSVRVARGSMLSCVRVEYVGGPERSDVADLLDCFREGRFDGMTDSYNYDNSRHLLIDGIHYRPGVEYITVQRERTEAERAAALATMEG